MKDKLIKLTGKIFSYAMAVLMLLFVFILITYMVMLLIGGNVAIAMNDFISVHILPKMYIASVISSFIGLLNMYLRGEKAFTLDSGMKNRDEGKR